MRKRKYTKQCYERDINALINMEEALKKHPGKTFTEEEISKISGYSRKTIRAIYAQATIKILHNEKFKSVAKDFGHNYQP